MHARLPPAELFLAASLALALQPVCTSLCVCCCALDELWSCLRFTHAQAQAKRVQGEQVRRLASHPVLPLLTALSSSTAGKAESETSNHRLPLVACFHLVSDSMRRSSVYSQVLCKVPRTCSHFVLDPGALEYLARAVKTCSSRQRGNVPAHHTCIDDGCSDGLRIIVAPRDNAGAHKHMYKPAICSAANIMARLPHLQAPPSHEARRSVPDCGNQLA
jgi:hypothetical protein